MSENPPHKNPSSAFEFLFKTRGRIGRETFWSSVGPVLVAFIIAGLFTTTSSGWLVDLVGGIGVPILLFMFVAISVKRLHDRNKSGHWLWLFVFMPFALPVVVNAVYRGTGASVLLYYPPIAGYLLLIWGLVEMGFLRGNNGENRYGPDPLESPVSAKNPVVENLINIPQQKTAFDWAQSVLKTEFVDDAKALIETLGGSISYGKTGSIFSAPEIVVHLDGEERLFHSEYEMTQWVA